MFARRAVYQSKLFTKRSFSINEKPSWFKKNLPLIGVMVGLSAFSFQIGVLFPWHEELSDQFKALEVI
jgi:hypothetical protein